MPERRLFDELGEDLQSEKKRSGDETDMRPCQARKEANSTPDGAWSTQELPLLSSLQI